MTEKEKFLKELNEAYARADVEYIIDQVTDDVVWHVIGEGPISGKDAFEQATRAMQDDLPLDLNLSNIITHGRMAAVNGIMKMKSKSGEMKTYAFCDVYKFNGFKDLKIKEITSYVIEDKEQK